MTSNIMVMMMTMTMMIMMIMMIIVIVFIIIRIMMVMVMRTLMLLLLVIGMDGDEWEEQNLWSSLDSTLAMKCSLPKILHTVHTRVQPQRNMNMENLPCSRFWGGFTVLFSWVTTTFESPSLIASGSKATIETVSCEHGRTEHISIGTSKRNFICWILNQQKFRQTMLFLVTYS